MLSNRKVILKNLTVNDAKFFHGLYTHPALAINFDESPFLPNETPIEFTERIISICEYIFTIRPTDNPTLIIGDCALHHWDKLNKEIEIGGSLLPEYWGKGYMQAAFDLLVEVSKQELGVTALMGQTKTQNVKAVKFAEKMGFVRCKTDARDTLMRKVLV
ncbi:GNAT family N-acetyltransferase [Paradesertivirga mongoliensis]|uniref:GNAT family N-acetyltransferase n=1 Tax=Paradesertivirga mongoliensis TaxID=2100740 RepID=A0ABW4ZMU3_9SPHI|nr:GNAT family N-acetyltransferase [Pedobacter mongoliensis]